MDTKMHDLQLTPKKRPIRWLIRTLKWLVVTALVVLIVAGFVLTNLPKISAEVSGSLRSNDTMGTVFSVSNEGSRPVYDVKAGCEVMRVDVLPPGNRHFVGPETFYFAESRAQILPPRHKMTVPCGRAIATKLNNVETNEVYAQVFIVVTYKPKGLWWYKSEKFPMGTEKTENGTWKWKSMPKD
jgi:hypothetical protein